MDLLAHVPSWDDIERNLDHRFSELNQSVSSGWQSAHDGWNGFTRRVSNGANRAYGAMGGTRIDNVRHAMALSYPIMQTNLSRKWASINISQILPVLIKLVQEVVMILGGSVAVGGAVGGAAGSLAFGIGAAPGAVAGAGIGLQVGNLILMALGLSAIAEYFYKGLPACLASLQEGLATAWHAEDGLKPPGLDPTGGSSAQMQERTERAARQLARGQEQLVMLLLTAIVTYLTRGQMKAGVMNSMESIATRSAKLQAEISNKQFADWLAKNQSKILAEPELQVKEVAPLKKAAQPDQRSNPKEKLEEFKIVDKVKPKYKPGFTEADILKIPKGERPLPETYLDQDYMKAHLNSFEEGGGFLFTPDDIADVNRSGFNPKKFVMQKNDLEQVIAEYKKANDLSILESALGYDPGSLANKDIYMLTLDRPTVLMPAGNEGGVNSLWRPGGLTFPGGMREAVLDNISIPHNNSIDSVISTQKVLKIQ
ncbi:MULTISPECIES: DUF6861 domain-containing protein [unclassified Pseudomonas]|uniref:DUF6861 domain-containing protein n=1 Tax=unclassified Pseudomonas TaxID=196821 RepID=UPI002113FBF5|nr:MULTISPECIES: glycine zipper family protein [unclassified Pseudomonas]